MVYNNTDFLKHIDTIKPLAFDRVGEQSIYKKIESDRKLVLQVASSDYFPHGSYIKGVIADIAFNSVEEILAPLYLAEGVEKYRGHTIGNTMVDIEGVDYKLLEQEINDDVSFAKVSGELQKLINAALAFFDQYKTIEEVANLLADKEPKEIVPYIQGTILLPKTVLILKLANHPRFEERKNQFYELVKKQATKKKQAEADLRVFEKLLV